MTVHDAIVGQVITTGIPGPRLDVATRRALELLGPGGVVLFARNIEDVAQLRELTAALHALPSRPLVAIDHEGGRVTRLGPPLTQFPAAAAVGRSGTEATYAVGRAMGLELASLGIDVDYAPVLDVDSNPANPVIGDRAFSSDPTAAAALGLAFMRGLQSAGIRPCGKHFPGHGNTDRDSHLEQPIVRRDRAALDAVELLPFRAAIAAAIPLLMTAHVLYPALDPDNPATLSPLILGGLLRRELGFGGVVVSDDLAMRAISDRMPVADAAVAALRAGVDCVLVCHDLEESLHAADRIGSAVAHGGLDAGALAASAARIARLRGAVRRPPPLTLPVAEHVALAERLHGMVRDGIA
jgi:beta-N-acetylhexosaminidase